MHSSLVAFVSRASAEGRNERSRFPELPVLRELAASLASRVRPRLDGVGLICVQHLLETTGSLMETLFGLGLHPSNSFILGKAYSTNQDVVDRLRQCGSHVDGGSLPSSLGTFEDAIAADLVQLWSAASALRRPDIHTLIILDDGGRCLASVPHWARQDGRRMCGVEQTQFGADRLGLVSLPVVLVARSGVKKWIEPPMIARAVKRRIASVVARCGPKTTVGVVGLGPIGKAVAEELLRNGLQVLAYDNAATPEWPGKGVRKCSRLRQLVEDSTMVFGCTGADIFEAAGLDEYPSIGCRALASCSSEDIEFRSVLRRYADAVPLGPSQALQDVLCQVGNHELRVLRGGFPVNFDGTKESVPASEIQVTRGLLLGGVVQALLMTELPSIPATGSFQLASAVQDCVMRSWLAAENPSEGDYFRGVRSAETRARLINASSGVPRLPEIERAMML